MSVFASEPQAFLVRGLEEAVGFKDHCADLKRFVSWCCIQQDFTLKEELTIHRLANEAANRVDRMASGIRSIGLID